VFPTFYRLNTRRALNRMLQVGGFREIAFAYVDVCPVFARFKRVSRWEIAIWKLIRRAGLRYPENNILCVYQRDN
jgi:hypothetical protein